jgi:uncharacterized membrane protein YeaQ/YmgE (transglycosylase-associated protein family)
MSTILYLAAMAAIALLVGAIARLLLPGKDDINLLGTLMLGLVVSFTGGLLGWIIFGNHNGSGLIGSVLFAVLILYTVRKINGGGLRDPGDA